MSKCARCGYNHPMVGKSPEHLADATRFAYGFFVVLGFFGAWLLWVMS